MGRKAEAIFLTGWVWGTWEASSQVGNMGLDYAQIRLFGRLWHGGAGEVIWEQLIDELKPKVSVVPVTVGKNRAKTGT